MRIGCGELLRLGLLELRGGHYWEALAAYVLRLKARLDPRWQMPNVRTMALERILLSVQPMRREGSSSSSGPGLQCAASRQTIGLTASLCLAATWASDVLQKRMVWSADCGRWSESHNSHCSIGQHVAVGSVARS